MKWMAARALVLAVGVVCLTAGRAWADQEAALDPEASRGDAPAVFGDAPAVAASLAPQVGGAWARVGNVPAGFNPIHAVPGPNGWVLLVAGSGNVGDNLLTRNLQSYAWRPASGAWRRVPTPDDLFCAGHVLMAPDARHPDGWALIAGGTTDYSPFRGARFAYAFDFRRLRYERLADMGVGRWYPEPTRLGDGRVMFSGGFTERGEKGSSSEVFDPRSGEWSLLPGRHLLPNYPGVHLAKRGLFFDGTASGGSKLSPPGWWSPWSAARPFTPVPGLRQPRDAASSCWLGDVRDQRLMVVGGGWPATASTQVIDLDAPAPRWVDGPPLAEPKGYASCTQLPDGSLLEAGGGRANRLAQASREAAVLPVGGVQWQPANPVPDQRLYHSFLCPLDDGSVLSLTSNPKGGDPWSRSTLIYRPAYFWRGRQPVLRAWPRVARLGGSYVVRTDAPRVAVTAVTSPTHSHETNQRWVSLAVVGGRVRLPSSSSILPPGPYRMWALSAAGRPSRGRWLTITR